MSAARLAANDDAVHMSVSGKSLPLKDRRPCAPAPSSSDTCERGGSLGTPIGKARRLTAAGTTDQPIRRARHPQRPAIQDVRIDHRRAHVLVAKQLLDRADVIAVLQQMCREGVPQRIRTLLMNPPQPSFTTVTIPFTANQ